MNLNYRRRLKSVLIIRGRINVVAEITKRDKT